MRNVNVGVLGHVDSGKTSLVKALSTQLSTAALDKHPASQERGITLDLGFSCVESYDAHGSRSTVTLVDCPGHASLLRTIICGASIIDAMILVLDGAKGIQTQTAECVVIAEIVGLESVIVALNKADLVTADRLDALQKRVEKTLSKTKAEVVRVSAAPREGGASGIEELASRLLRLIATDDEADGGAAARIESNASRDATSSPPTRDERTILAVDHAFPLRGHGHIATGTVLNGTVREGMLLEMPSIGRGFTRRVKTIQAFHQTIREAGRGARVGISVEKLDASLPERFYAIAPVGSTRTTKVLFGTIVGVPYYKEPVKSLQKFHLHVGHAVTMCKVTLLSAKQNHRSLDVLHTDFLAESELVTTENRCFYAVFELEREVVAIENRAAIGTKLDADLATKSCRIAFSTTVLRCLDEGWRDTLVVYRKKSKSGTVDRVTGARDAIAQGLFDKDADMSRFLGFKVLVHIPSGDSTSSTLEGGRTVLARISKAFGKAGKVRLSADRDTFTDDCTGCRVTLEYNKITRRDGRKEFEQADP